MEPKLDLADVTISEPQDTITLSSYPWSYSNTTISGGGYTVSNVPNASITATSYPYTIGSGTGITSPWGATNLSSKIRLDGEGADIEVNGESLIGMIKKIEERLNILHPNEQMEEEWAQLRELGKQYRALEAKLIEQADMWAKLRAITPPKID